MSRAVLLAASCSLAYLAAGCGGDDGATTDAATDARVDGAVDASTDASPVFALTSTKLTEGGNFLPAYTCNGANVSLPLSWGEPPAGTSGFAVVLVDRVNNLIHWVIYDLPVSRFALPEDVDKTYAPADVPGAHQTASYDAQVVGYLGPCPPLLHTYKFTLYAVDVAVLPGATATSTRAQLQAMILDHDLASVTLSGNYQQQ